MAKRGLIDQWRENNRRGDGKSGGCGYYSAVVVNGRDVCRRCSRDLGPAGQR